MSQPIEQLEVYATTCRLADEIHGIVAQWNLQQKTIGIQLCRSADGVGANLVVGDYRESRRDKKRFFDMAHASCLETQDWIERAIADGVLDKATGERLANESAMIGRMIADLINRRKATLGLDIEDQELDR